MKKHLPPLKALVAFDAVATHLSFQAAAEALHLTNSAISQSIKQLESHFEQSLFDRDNRQVALTPAGKLLAEYVSRALATIREGCQAIGQEYQNRITLNMITTMAIRWFIPRLEQLQQSLPDIDLRLSTQLLQSEVLNEDVDIAIHYGKAPEHEGWVITKLCDDYLSPVASPKLLAQYKAPEEALNKATWIYVNAPSRLRDWPLWCSTKKRDEAPETRRLIFQNSAQAMQATVNGLGIAMAHELFVTDALQSGTLQRLSKSVLAVHDAAYYIIYREHTDKKAQLESIAIWLKQRAYQPTLPNT